MTPRKWTEEEISLLRAAYGTTPPNELFRLFQYHSRDAVRRKAQRLKLQRRLTTEQNSERGKRAAALRAERYKEELRHRELALPPIYNYKKVPNAGKLQRKKQRARAILRRRGYIIPWRDAHDIYYTETTDRRPILEYKYSRLYHFRFEAKKR